MASRDYYKILGVSRDATDAQIRSAYRKLARKYHPDVNPDDKKAEDRFKEMAEAYAVLGDKEKRSQYDQRGPEGFSPGIDMSEVFRRARAGGVEGFDLGGLGSIFGDLFGGGPARGGRPAPTRGADLQAELTIAFEDAVRGVTLPLTVQRQGSCKTCGGSGQGVGAAGGPCRECGGTGSHQVAQGPLQFRSPCPHCGGTGAEPGPACPTCRGSGVTPRSESLTVRIPAGVDQDSKIRVAGVGQAGPGGGPPGDLYVRIHVKPHKLFRREGQALVATLPITLAEATLGAQVEVPTLDGTATMKIPSGTKSGQRFRIRGKGVPSRRKSGAGDLMVDIQIVPPKKIDKESRRLMEEFAERNPQAKLRSDLGRR
jgi:molecular chaperone DnaJ